MEINSNKEYSKFIRGIIHDDLTLRKLSIGRLQGISRINGSFRIVDCKFTNVRDLKVITGDFSLTAYSDYHYLESLGSLERIEGNVFLNHTRIKSLGELSYVGKTVNLTGVPIDNMGKLRFIGGDLILPKESSNYDLSRIKVCGKVKVNRRARAVQIRTKKELELEESELEIPTIFDLPTENLFSFSQQQKLKHSHFYEYFKKRYDKFSPIDLKNSGVFSIYLFYEMLLQATETGKSKDYIVERANKIHEYYPFSQTASVFDLIEILNEKGEFKQAWDCYCVFFNPSFETYLDYQKKVNCDLLDGHTIVHMAGFSSLTSFGKKNLQDLSYFIKKEFDQFESRSGKEFYSVFIKDGSFYSNPRKRLDYKIHESSGIYDNEILDSFDHPEYDQEYYKNFFLSESEFLHYKRIDNSQYLSGYKNPYPHVPSNAITNQLRKIVRNGENLYRKEKGLPLIGEGWISETELYYRIKNSFPDLEVEHHASPKWLGRQHLDIYIKRFNIAIEYQGIQHYEAVEIFGGKEGLQKTQERDELKKQKCISNNCSLIYVNEGYDYSEVESKLRHLINHKGI